MSSALVGCQSFWQTASIAQNTWCYLAAYDHNDDVGDDDAGDGGHWRWWGLSKSHAWYYRWNERPPPGLIIRPGSPLIYWLSRTSPLLLLLHCFIICWTAQTSSLLFFLSTSTSLPTVSHWPWLQVSQHMVAWCISGQCLLFPPASRKCTIRFCRSGASAFLRQSVHVGTLLARTQHMRIVHPIALHIVSINHSMFVHSCLWLKTHLGFM